MWVWVGVVHGCMGMGDRECGSVRVCVFSQVCVWWAGPFQRPPFFHTRVHKPPAPPPQPTSNCPIWLMAAAATIHQASHLPPTCGTARGGGHSGGGAWGFRV